MFTNWKRNADKETRLNPLSIDNIDALTIASLRGMGTTPEKFRSNVQQDMPEDIMEQGEEIMRRNPKVTMPESHFKLQGAQEQQMMDDIELEIPEFEFNEEEALKNARMQEMNREIPIQRMNEAYKKTYKDHVMQAFEKHKAFMQSLGNQPMTAQEFMQHPKVPSLTDYINQAKEGTMPGGDNADEHPFAMTHPKEFIQHRDGTGDILPPIGMGGTFRNDDPFIPVITGEPMDLAMDILLKAGQFQSAAQRRIYSEIPTLEERGLEAKDVPFIRNIGVHRIESANMPAFNIPVPLRGERPGDPLRFERDVYASGGATIPGFTPDYQIPDDPRKEIQGTFVYSNDLQSLSPELRMGYPDFNWGIGDTVTLGILDKPEWLAGQAHGRTQPEGYQPFGFDKDAFVRLDDGLGTAAIAPRRELVSSARRLLTGNPLTGDEYKYYDYKPLYDMLSKLPATTLESQRDPVTGYLPKTSDFLLDRTGGARIVASEPMDLAIDALLKRDFDSWEVHPGENQYKHNYKMPNPDDVHPEWYDWLHEVINEPWEYEGIMDDYQQPDIDHLTGATSREDFFERLYDLHNFQVDDASPPHNIIDGVRNFTDIPFNEETGFTRSEPMDLAIDALLKRELHPGYPEDMSIEDMINAGHDYPFNKDKYPDGYLANYPEEHIEEYGKKPFNPTEPGEQPLHVGLNGLPPYSQRDIDAHREQMYRETLERMNAIDNSRDNESWAKWVASEAMPPAPQDSPLRLTRQIMVPVKNADENDVDALMDMPDETGATVVQSFAGIPMNEKTGFTRSEPMALAMDALLKDLSPEAKRHKLEYDKKYESSPERVKYREELNRERRRRGIYGSGDHMDVSHTEGGKLTLESEHDNRARHFKDKGTLRPSD